MFLRDEGFNNRNRHDRCRGVFANELGCYTGFVHGIVKSVQSRRKVVESKVLHETAYTAGVEKRLETRFVAATVFTSIKTAKTQS